MHKRMGQSARADCAVRAKYYLVVRRSRLWLGRRLQCIWTHVVHITIPITFWIAIRNIFRNVILAHVNTATVCLICPKCRYRAVFMDTIYICGGAMVYGLNPWLWIKGLQVRFPSNVWHSLSFSKTHCCSPLRCISGYLVECERYNVFVAWCGMCAPLKWCLARMLPRELRMCTLSAGLILNPMMGCFSIVYLLKMCKKQLLSNWNSRDYIKENNI